MKDNKLCTGCTTNERDGDGYEALLAGIVLDTKNFTMRTGGRTFEAAAFLRRSGADTAEVKKLFQNDLAGTIAKYSIIQNAKLYKNNIAVAVAKPPGEPGHRRPGGGRAAEHHRRQGVYRIYGI